MKIAYLHRAGGLATLLAAGVLSVSFDTASTPVYLLQRVVEFYRSSQPEVSYLHLDQDAYAAGETLWFKAYLLDARAHQPDSLSKVLYVDVVAPDRQVLFKRTLALTDGQAAGDIVLPDTLTSGVYTLRAYTSWMRNNDEGLFFTRRIPIWQASAPNWGDNTPVARRAMLAVRANRAIKAAAEPDVQFFPEGGELVAGLATMVGVKATDASGHGLAVQGSIFDGNRREVARFSTPALGMTSVNLTPQAGQKYRAEVELPDGSTVAYQLPTVQATGWGLNVREIGDEFRVFVRRAGGTTPEPLQLVAHVRSKAVYAADGRVGPGETFFAAIPKSQAPAGVLHITLFDGTSTPQAERLVFVPETRPLQVRLRPDKATYGPRQLVNLEVEVTTADGQPAPAELSLAVASTAGLPAGAGDATTVRAHLLLTSELRGYVENPAYYLQPRTPQLQQALDNLLLTQGWSRFTWQQVLAPVSPAAEYLHPLERSLTLSGQLLRLNNKPVPAGELSIMFGTDLNVAQLKADNEGRFLLTGFEGRDSTRVLVQGVTPKGNSKTQVRINDLWPAPAERWQPLAPLPPADVTAPAVVAYGQRSRRQQLLEQQFRPDATSGIVLRNVDIKGKRTPPVRSPFSLPPGRAQVLKASDLPNVAAYRNVFEMLQSRFAGVEVYPSGTSYAVVMRGLAGLSGSVPPVFVLDGVPLTDSDILLSIAPVTVDRIEVMKGPPPPMYAGTQGMKSGVVAVFTKQGISDDPASNTTGTIARRLPAYHRAREFYAPRYETNRPTDKPDPRATTLYWQPRLTVPASGRARVSFYTADQAGAFRASVEGVSLAGQPATAEAALTVAAQP